LKVEPQAVVEQNVTMFSVLVSIQNPDGLLMPGMNAEVEVSIARSENSLTIPVMALRTNRDLESTAGILGRTEDDIREALRSSADEAPTDPDTRETVEMRGKTIELPTGVKAADVRALMKKRRDGGTLTDDEQKLMRRVFQSATEKSTNPSTQQPSDYRFGGNFWVVLDNEARDVKRIKTGVTDLDRVEVVAGLDETDRVLVLPSSHLVETQQDLQNFINRRVGRVPGIGR